MKPSQNCIIVTSADSPFFPFLETMVLSLARFKSLLKFSFGVLDQGLTEAEKKSIEQKMDVIWVKPVWHHWVPQALRNKKYIGLQARMELRDYFPGYKYYLWFDADAWCQTSEFFNAFISGARQNGAAVVKENGIGYKKTLSDLKWWYGNLFCCYGLKDGFRIAANKSVNIGLLCLKNNAPHWKSWKSKYEEGIKKTEKINMDQHALFAGIHLDKLATSYLDSRFNWLPHLSQPIWHTTKMAFCVPQEPYKIISVLHLAGPNKERTYNLSTQQKKNIKKKIKFKNNFFE